MGKLRGRPNVFREELKGNVSIVRELHVYGSAIPVHSRSTSQFQHKGYGTLLMEEAERIAREEHFSDKIAVISGVGTRHYYRKLGYSLDGVYMSKMLNWIVCSNRKERMNELGWNGMEWNGVEWDGMGIE